MVACFCEIGIAVRAVFKKLERYDDASDEQPFDVNKVRLPLNISWGHFEVGILFDQSINVGNHDHKHVGWTLKCKSKLHNESRNVRCLLALLIEY